MNEVKKYLKFAAVVSVAIGALRVLLQAEQFGIPFSIT